MAKNLLHEQAIQLRLKGFSYGQIKRELGIEKSTLSNWLSKYQLTPDQLLLLKENNARTRDLAAEKFRETFRIRRINKLREVLRDQESKLLPLTERELLIAGLFLYWGEGSKHRGVVSISNSDPKIIKFALYWLTEVLKIPKGKIKARLHAYQDMNVAEELEFWSEILDLPTSQFKPTYMKVTNRSGLTYKSFGHGTCNIYFSSVLISDQIAMSIKAISDRYGAKTDLFWYN
jgi:transposase-like protein